MTRNSSARALIWSGTEHSTSDATPASKGPFSCRQVVGNAIGHDDLNRSLGRRLAREVAQVRLRLESDDLGDSVRIMAEVQSVAGADLDDSSGKPRQHLLSVLARACILHPLAHTREHAREDGMREVARAHRAKASCSAANPLNKTTSDHP